MGATKRPGSSFFWDEKLPPTVVLVYFKGYDGMFTRVLTGGFDQPSRWSVGQGRGLRFPLPKVQTDTCNWTLPRQLENVSILCAGLCKFGSLRLRSKYDIYIYISISVEL